jgi:ankyrin repeat protein
LFTAVWGGQTEAVKVLVEFQADLDQADDRGVTPLGIAAVRGHEGIVKVLLDAKADPNPAPDKYGATPLSGAKENGRQGKGSVTDLLERAGALK